MDLTSAAFISDSLLSGARQGGHELVKGLASKNESGAVRVGNSNADAEPAALISLNQFVLM